MFQKNVFPVIVVEQTSGSPLSIRGDYRFEGIFGGVQVYTHDGGETKRWTGDGYVPDERVFYHHRRYSWDGSNDLLLLDPPYALVHPATFKKLDKKRLAVDLKAMADMKGVQP